MITAVFMGLMFGDLVDLQVFAAIRINDPPDHQFPHAPVNIS
jgi:hypothetical protein